MDWWIGTSGYSYPAWKGAFYPEGLPSSRLLGYFAGRLNAVEVNNTFYRLPKPEVIRGWRDQVPDRFRFVIKASRRITHFARLGPEAHDPAEYLAGTVAELGDRLGAVLFQLPPNLRADPERLGAFLEVLPRTLPVAFEFRHPSWMDDGVQEMLAERDVALVHADLDGGDDPPLVSTAGWGYARLRRAAYTDADLDAWVGRIRAHPWDRVFVFFKHEDEGTAPRLAEKLLNSIRT